MSVRCRDVWGYRFQNWGHGNPPRPPPPHPSLLEIKETKFYIVDLQSRPPPLLSHQYAKFTNKILFNLIRNAVDRNEIQ